MSLSSLIVQREVATIRQVEEALARQVIYGGDLVTNLLEVTAVDEATLTPLLAESMGLRPGPIGELPPPIDRVRALVPPEMAAHRAMAPLGVEGDKLVLAVAEPLPASVADELAFALGMRLDLRAAPMVRVREVLTRAYGLPLERRMERLIARLEGKPVASGSMPPLFGDPQQVAEPPRPPSAPPFKMSPAFGMARPSQLPSRKITSAGFPALRAPALDEGWTEPGVAAPPPPGRVSTPAPLPVPAPARPPDAVPPSAAVSSRPPSTAPTPKAPSQPAAERASARPPQLVARDVTPAPRPVRRRRGPLTSEVATKELEEAPDRDALLDLFFEYARQFFDYSALFLVHGDIAEGRDAFGEGASRERVLGIGVPLDLPGLLATAREKKKVVTARPAPDGLDGVLLHDLMRMPKTPVIVVPLVVRARCVALLLGDFGGGGHDPGSAGEVSSFALAVGRAFERLIVRRKLSGFIAGSRAGGEGRVDRAVMTQLAAKSRAPSEAVAEAEPEPSAPMPPSPPPPSPPVVPPSEPERDVDTPLSASPLAESVEAPPVDVPVPAPAPAAPAPVPVAVPVAPVPDMLAHAVVDERAANGAAGASSSAHAEQLERPAQEQPPPPLPEPTPAQPEPAPEPAPAPPALVATVIASDAERVVQTLTNAPEPESAPPNVTSAFPPPPASIVAVRRPTGPPIPREEPPDSSPMPVSGPHIEAEPVDDAAARELLDTIDRESGERFEEQAPPSSASHSVAIPPHLPPSSRSFAAGPLPSVIVDMNEEMGALVDRLASHGADDAAEAELLRQGAHAMPAIMLRFPGPILVDRGRIASEGTPRASECGPILRLVAGQRRVALPFVIQKLEHPDHEQRYWATLLLAELQYPEAVPAAVGRLFDEQARIRRAARVAAAAMAKRGPHVVIDEIEKHIASAEHRSLAVDALGELREPEVVPLLVRILEEHGKRDETTAQAARRALGIVTRQDFGMDAKKWEAWWQLQGAKSRIEWLIDALDHEVSENRRAAGEELRALTKEYFGYAHDLPPRERQRAQQRYRDWWATEGRARFRRARPG